MTMQLPQRRFLPHATPAWVCSGSVFFLTLCCQQRGENQLCHARIAPTLFEAVEFRQRLGRWYVHLLLLMPDHLHGLVSFPTQEDMRKVVAGFKEMTAKRAGIVWQRDFFDHRLRNDSAYEEKADYIRMNPVRKGLADSPEKWPWAWTNAQLAAGPAVPPYLQSDGPAQSPE